MTHRARFSGAIGTVVDGNFRDLEEHRKLGYPVSSRKATRESVGTGMLTNAQVFARDVATPAFYEVARASEVRMRPPVSPGSLSLTSLGQRLCIVPRFPRRCYHQPWRLHSW